MKDGYHVNCTMSSNFLLDKGRVAENLQKECLCYFIINERGFTLFTFIWTLLKNDYLDGFHVFSRAMIAYITHISPFHVSLRLKSHD